MTTPLNNDGTPVSQRQWLMLIAERDALHAKVVTVEALLRYPAFELIQRYFLGEYLGDEPWRAEILTLRNAAFNLSQQAERAEAERDALAALLKEAKRYRGVLRQVFFLEHNEREWESLEDCQFWAKQECDAIDAALAAHKEGK